MSSGLIGTVIDGRYRILSKLGSGGSGTVYRAQQLDLSRYVAIKLLHGQKDLTPEALARFQREAQALASLKHKNIVEVYSFGLWEEEFPYMVMELVEGKALSTVIASERTLAEKRLIKVAIQVVVAMEAVHLNGIIHRDLKPQNIMLIGTPEEETVKLLDFGLSKILPQSAEEVQKLTETGILVGSAFYMSPEACEGKPVDKRSDIYSFSCVMYECITGSPPFTADTPIGVLYKHRNDSVGRPSEQSGVNISGELEAVILRCLSKDPDKRYQSFAELKWALELMQSGRSGEVTQFFEAAKTTSSKSAGARIRLWAAIATVLALVCGTLAMNTNEGKCLLARYDLKMHNNADRRMYWLNVADEMESRGQAAVALKLLHEVEESLAGKDIEQARIYIKFAGSQSDKAKKYRWTNKAIDTLSHMSDKRMPLEAGCQMAIQACDFLVQSGMRPDRKQLMKLWRFQRLIPCEAGSENYYRLFLEAGRYSGLSAKDICGLRTRRDLLRAKMGMGQVLVAELPKKLKERSGWEDGARSLLLDLLKISGELQRAGDSENAKIIFVQATRVLQEDGFLKDPETTNYLVSVCTALGRLDEAEKWALRTVELPALSYHNFETSDWSRQRKTAIGSLEGPARPQNSCQLMALQFLISRYDDRADYKNLAKYSLLALQREEANHSINAQAAKLYVDAVIKQGKCRQAVKDLSALIEKSKLKIDESCQMRAYYVTLLTARGRSRLELGEKDSAERDFGKADSVVAEFEGHNSEERMLRYALASGYAAAQSYSRYRKTFSEIVALPIERSLKSIPEEFAELSILIALLPPEQKELRQAAGKYLFDLNNRMLDNGRFSVDDVIGNSSLIIHCELPEEALALVDMSMKKIPDSRLAEQRLYALGAYMGKLRAENRKEELNKLCKSLEPISQFDAFMNFPNFAIFLEQYFAAGVYLRMSGLTERAQSLVEKALKAYPDSSRLTNQKLLIFGSHMGLLRHENKKSELGKFCKSLEPISQFDVLMSSQCYANFLEEFVAAGDFCGRYAGLDNAVLKYIDHISGDKKLGRLWFRFSVHLSDLYWKEGKREQSVRVSEQILKDDSKVKLAGDNDLVRNNWQKLSARYSALARPRDAEAALAEFLNYSDTPAKRIEAISAIVSYYAYTHDKNKYESFKKLLELEMKSLPAQDPMRKTATESLTKAAGVWAGKNRK